MSGRVFQIMEALDHGDGVSDMVRAFVPVLTKHGVERAILTLHAHDAVRAETLPFESVTWRPGDAVIVHVWNYTNMETFLRTFPGRKAIYFNNITPPDFFEPGTAAHTATRAGWDQLPHLVELADMWLAPSAYNLAAVRAVGRAPHRERVIPPLIDAHEEQTRPVNARLLEILRARGEVNILFVGRLAPNKFQERVMAVFDYYHSRINRRSRLHLVGDASGNPGYAEQLEMFRTRLASGDAIELPGKVNDLDLQAYYHAADLFLCLSEHEGFGLPPLIAAAHGVPVLARAAAALPEPWEGRRSSCTTTIRPGSPS